MTSQSLHRLIVRAALRLAASVAVLATLGGAQAQSSRGCTPSWVPTFGEIPGVDATVEAYAVFDDGLGGGPAVYAAGSFTTIGGLAAKRIARFDGTNWSTLGDGLDGGVTALCVFDDGAGGGPALYAGGAFNSAGGGVATNIARWNGTSWSPVGSGIGAPGDSVAALVVHDDGSGPALYAGGFFVTSFGGQPASNIARWNGTAWSPVGFGMDKGIMALASFDAPGGGGPTLFAGGYFNTADGSAASKIAEWNGASWTGINSLMTSTSIVLSLASFDGGTGEKLYVGGYFDTAGGLLCRSIATWSGSAWGTVGLGMSEVLPGTKPEVEALQVIDVDGGGPALYAGGWFLRAGGALAHNIAKWNGTSWSSLDGGNTGTNFSEVRSLGAFDAGTGLELYLGGNFDEAGGVAALGAARWNGADWSQVVPSASGRINGAVRSVAAFDDGLGGGPALYATGDFRLAGAVPVNYVAKWDGTHWLPLGSGLSAPGSFLAVFDDGQGGGPALYAAGFFAKAGGKPGTANIARWDGTTWSSVGAPLAGIYSVIRDLQVLDDGTGSKLYLAGDSADHADVRIWDGVTLTAWSDGKTSGSGSLAYAFFDDGSGDGPALIACGDSYYVGGDYHDIAKWNGTGWSALGPGDTPAGAPPADAALAAGITNVLDLAVFDDGSGNGPALYAAGDFESVASWMNNIARWNGTSWTSVGGTNASVTSLAVFDDGSGDGPALYAAGLFTVAGEESVHRIAKWDGTSWSEVGAGLGGLYDSLAETTMEVLDLGSGPSLYVGGDLFSAVDSGDGFLAQWGGCPVAPSPWSFVGYALPGIAGPPLLAGQGPLTPGSAGSLVLTHAAPSAPSLLFISLGASFAPFKGGLLVPVPALLTLSIPTDASGGVFLPYLWPAGVPPATTLYFQFAVQDAAGPKGVSLSNAVKAVTP